MQEWIQRVGRFFFSRQTNSGSEAIQVGKVHGNLTIVNVSHHVGHRTERTDDLRHMQKQVLRMMSKLKNRIPVLEFMQREFGTSMVIHLDHSQLKRTRGYVEAIVKSNETQHRSQNRYPHQQPKSYSQNDVVKAPTETV